jgi:hypothetical protein
LQMIVVRRYVTALFVVASLGYGQIPQKHRGTELSSQVEIPIRRLYRQLVSRPIVGIPTTKRMKTISPYLSNSLDRKITRARACGEDWFRQHPKNDVKAPLDWLESGLFSGANDRAGPFAFQIEKTESQDDGSFRVYMNLKGGTPENAWTWPVAVVVVRENGQFKVDDVIYLKDKDLDTESRLSELLARGCDGSRWVGFKRSKP